MNKGQLIEKVAGRCFAQKSETERMINVIFETISDEIAVGGHVKIIGFGTFLQGKRKARFGVNPQTKEKIKIPSKRFPKFRAGASLRDSM